MSTTDYKLIDRRIGLLSGSVLLLGTVIGISVFFLPGELIGQAGPSILLALAITAVPMAFSVLGLLQLGGAMPVAGGSYVYGSRLVSPAWGFMTIWLVLPAIWATLSFTALGFGEFARVFVDVPVEVLAVAVIVAFAGLNLRGVTVVTWVQLVMVVAIAAAILAFVVTGVPRVEVANYTPLLPQGLEPALLAVVSLYIPFQGFSMIVELGEELDDPIRNIPRVLVVGMGLAVLLSVALVTVFVGLDRWDVLGGLEEGGIAQAAATYLPGWVSVAVVIGAVLGAFTTLNAVITAYSRTLMRAGRDGVLPPRLAAVGRRTQVPYWGVLALTVPPLAIVVVRPSVVLLTVFLALVILFGNFVGSLALWNLPTRFPAAYEHSIYRLPMWLLKTSAIGSATFAVLFWLAIVASAPAIIVLLVAVILAGFVAYGGRVLLLRSRGLDLRARLRQLDAHEELAAGITSAPDAPQAPGTAASRTSGVVVAIPDAAVPAGSTDGAGPRPPRRIRVATPPPSQLAAAAERLGDVPGLGPHRREALLRHFGSLHAIAAASHEELCAVDGVGDGLAHRIRDRLTPTADAAPTGR